MADSIEDAVSRALEDSPERNFRETVDLAINLRDLDLEDPNNRVDESIVLPSGTGQDTHIVVFAEGDTALRAEDVADEVLEVLAVEHLVRHVLGPEGGLALGENDDVRVLARTRR